jgi:hypothetical protein
MEKLSDDLIVGADNLAEFVFGDKEKRRRIYHLNEAGKLPLFNLGPRLAGRRSTLTRFIEEQEQAAMAERTKRAEKAA